MHCSKYFLPEIPTEYCGDASMTFHSTDRGGHKLQYIRSILSLALVAVFATPACAQKTPQETIESISAVDGFEVKLFAAEPMIVNPIAVDVDTYGRVWVTEGT